MALGLRMTPYLRLWLSIGIFVLVGWVLLMLPFMSAERPATWLEALFTSTSAVCVTGLIVRSTGHDWSFTGQVVILILIQIGGLGFMTLSSSVLMYLRRKATLGEMAVIRESLGEVSTETLPTVLFRCMKLVAFIEGIGAALLFVRFAWAAPEGTARLSHLPQALWAAVFHSVSAFCNAGFSIWDDSLMRFRGDVWVNGVMAGLIVLGGLGFFVLADLEAFLRGRKRRERHRFRYQTRLVLVTTVVLILTGAVLIWVGERNNSTTLGSASWVERVLVSGFQSITARTAGFNTVEMSDMSVPSVGVLMALMFIGASPGSCGGGIKTTTFAVLAALAFAAFRRRKQPSFQYRAFSAVTVRSAVALFFAAFLLVIFASVFLMLIETGGQPLREGESAFAGLLFEATSAFGTVGLSTGVTPQLKAPSQLCLIVLMFIGRVGPLGLISAAVRGGERPAVQLLSEHVQIG